MINAIKQRSNLHHHSILDIQKGNDGSLLAKLERASIGQYSELVSAVNYNLRQQQQHLHDSKRVRKTHPTEEERPFSASLLLLLLLFLHPPKHPQARTREGAPHYG